MNEDGVSAEDMLSEIASETLQQFLCSVRLGEGHGAMATQLGPLDACVLASGVSLKPGAVVEIQGPPASGKTHLVYQVVLSCILPNTLRPSGFEGWGKAAIVFDTDGTFDVGRIRTLLSAKITGSALAVEQDGDANVPGTDSGATCNARISECLRRLHIFRPSSSTQLAASILQLPNYHSTNPQMQKDEIGLLVIDSLSTFYWTDRFTMEQLRVGPSGYKIKTPLQHVVAALEKLYEAYLPVMVFTNWALNPLVNPDSTPGGSVPLFFKQHLHPFPSPGHRFTSYAPQPTMHPDEHHDTARDASSPSTEFSLTHHITLSSVPVSHVPPGRSLVEVEQEGDGKHSLGVIQGFLRTAGNDKARTFLFAIHGDKICPAS